MTLHDKKNYVCHLKNLQQAVSFGLELVECHNIIRFKQSFWLKPYIEKNNERRAQSNDDCTRNLYKLLNNSCYGRFALNKARFKDMHYVIDEKIMQKMVRKFNFCGREILDENSCIVEMRKRSVLVDTPFVVAFCILELSKVHMYSFYYDVLLSHFGPTNIKLLASDTDSYIIECKTNDFYEDILLLSKHFDTSNFPKEHKVYSNKNKGVLGLFKCEYIDPIRAFCGLRSKVYSVLIDNRSICKAKGTGKSAIMHKLKFEQYRECLFGKKALYTSFNTIQPHKFDMYTMKHNKKALCPLDTKRIVLEDNITTVAYGNKLINIV